MSLTRHGGRVNVSNRRKYVGSTTSVQTMLSPVLEDIHVVSESEPCREPVTQAWGCGRDQLQTELMDSLFFLADGELSLASNKEKENSNLMGQRSRWE